MHRDGTACRRAGRSPFAYVLIRKYGHWVVLDPGRSRSRLYASFDTIWCSNGWNLSKLDFSICHKYIYTPQWPNIRNHVSRGKTFRRRVRLDTCSSRLWIQGWRAETLNIFSVLWISQSYTVMSHTFDIHHVTAKMLRQKLYARSVKHGMNLSELHRYATTTTKTRKLAVLASNQSVLWKE